MRALKHRLSSLGNSFWFVPLLIVAGAIASAVLLVELDAAKGHHWMEDWPRIFGASADGARGILATIAGSMVTVVGVTFSMTLTTLALASNQYTSRILRNFMADRVTQVVLGVLAGIFTYCLVVLRTIRGGDEGDFVPSLAVAVSLLLAIGGVGALIGFIHHVASSIQASSIIASVADETLASVDRLFPDDFGSGEADEENPKPSPPPPMTEWQPVRATRNGYLQQVDADALLKHACKHDTVSRIELAVGDFVLRDSPLLSLALPKPPDDQTRRALQSCFFIDRHRTVDQDAAFGVRQIVDMALRAATPSTNDATTAGMCVNYLSAILARLALRKIPSDHRYEHGKLRLIAKGPSFEGLMSLAFEELIGSASGNVTLLIKVVGALETIGIRTRDRERRRIVRELLEQVAENGRRTVRAPPDAWRFEQSLEQARARLA